MSLPGKIILFKKSKKISSRIYAYVLFFVLHIALFNVNVAEWGDSYRILRASEYIRKGIYPSDEKRPPLFSVFTAVRPSDVDPVLWGRVVVFVFSLLAFIVFDKLTEIYIKDEKYRLISLILFILNPVYLYWSIRVMADVPFSFFVLLAFYLLSRYVERIKHRENEKGRKRVGFGNLIILGVVCGLAILTRFEGYLLAIAVLAGLALSDKKFHENENNGGKTSAEGSGFTFKLKSFFTQILKNWEKLLIFGLTTLIVISPWILNRNPFESSYFEEPSRRIYDFKMVWTYIVSILYLFGFTSAFYFIFKKPRNVILFLHKNLGITTFIILDLLLILVWPAAVPRLFVPLIPFFVLIFTISFRDFAETFGKSKGKTFAGISADTIFPAFLLLFYVVSQYFLKLQFLVPVKTAFAVIVLIQVLMLLSIYFRDSKVFFCLILLSTTFWSSSVIFNHKNIYTAIKSAGIYARDNLDGKIIFNDTTSVADWYINYSYPKENLIGEKRDFSDKKELDYKSLLKNNVSYVLITNEDNSNFNLDIENFGYLKLIQSFRYNIGSKEFFADILEFER